MKQLTKLNTITYNGNNSDLTVEYTFINDSITEESTITVPYDSINFLPFETLACTKIVNTVDNIDVLLYQSAREDIELNRRMIVTVKDNILGSIILNIEPQFKLFNGINMLVASSNFNEDEILNVIDVTGEEIATYIQTELNK